MPKITEIIEKQTDKKKKFTKKGYRPWNLSETVSADLSSVDLKPEGEKPSSIDAEKSTADKVQITRPNQYLDEKQIQLSRTSAQLVIPDPTKLVIEDILIQLSGHQKTLFIMIIRNLIEHSSLVTSPIYSNVLIEHIKTSLGTITNAVRRLESKGLITSMSKRARGGFFRFRVTEEVLVISQRLFFRA